MSNEAKQIVEKESIPLKKHSTGNFSVNRAEKKSLLHLSRIALLIALYNRLGGLIETRKKNFGSHVQKP